MPTSSTNNGPIRFIVGQSGIDTEYGIKGLGYSPDNGKTFVVEDTTDGRVYRLLDAKRLYPLLKPMFDQVYNSGPVETSLHWADILDKPDLITKQQLDDRLTAFTPAVSWDQVTGKPDLATQDDLKKIELTPGPSGKDGSPGRDGKPGSNGSDGVSPHIDSATGHWFVGSTDTGVSARGPQGQQGSPGKDGQTPDVSKLATKTDLTNYYTKAETDSEISSSIDKIQIGGRNLILNSSKETSGKSYDFAQYNFAEDLQPGETYTLSAYGRIDQTAIDHKQFIEIYVYAPDWSYDDFLKLPASLTNNYGQLTFTVPADKHPVKYVTVYLMHPDGATDKSKDNLSGTAFVNYLKLEKGNVATDWTPAPEDTTAAIQKNTTAIDQANQQITDLQTAVKTQQSAAIDTSSQSTNKKPSDYSDGIFHEVKYISALGIDRSELDVTAQAGTQVFLTTKAYNSYARQTAEVFDSNRPITFIRTGHNSTWNSWEVMTTW